jgi:hypothetical protein
LLALALTADTAPLTLHNLFGTVEGMVAVGTILLALGTGFLALKTRKLANETRVLAGSTAQEIELARQTAQDIQRQTKAIEGQAEVARDSLAATFRPVLVHVPHDFGGFRTDEVVRYPLGFQSALPVNERWIVTTAESEGHLHFGVPVRNVGQGVAFIVAAGMNYEAEEMFGGNPSNAIVPPGETARITFSISAEPENSATLLDRIKQYGTFSVLIRYSDLASNFWSTRLDLVSESMSRWYVHQVFVWPGEESESEAVSSGPMTGATNVPAGE